MMKEMSVEELIDESFDLVILDEHPEYKAELLRRFEKLEKENEGLRCCGNCKDYPYDLQHCRKKIYKNYCSMWTTDGLSREEREK
jgi:hypothetical protein